MMDGPVVVSQLGARMHYAVPRILKPAKGLRISIPTYARFRGGRAC